MFKYPPARQSPYFASQTWVIQLLWLLLSLCVSMAMIKPANAAVEQIRPLSGGNQYIWYVFQPSAYPGLVGRDALSACQAANKVLGTLGREYERCRQGRLYASLSLPPPVLVFWHRDDEQAFLDYHQPNYPAR